MKKFIILMALLFLLTGCQKTEGEIKETKEIIVETEVVRDPFKGFYTINISDFTPNKVSNYETKALMRNLHEGIFIIDENGKLNSGIAKEVNTSESDGYLIYDILLKEDARFHNGEKVTPEDVQYSVFRFTGLLSNVNNTQLENFKYWVNLLDGDEESGIKKGKVEIFGSDRILFYLDDFYGERITSSLFADTYIVPKDYSEEDQKVHPIGIGPYKFESMDESGNLILTRFEDYHGTKGKLQKVILSKISDKEERNLAFVNEELDILDSYPGRDKDKNYKPLSGDVYSLVFNMENETYKSKELRDALAATVNKESIHTQLFGQSGGVTETPLSPFLSSFIGNLELEPSYNLQVASDFIGKNPSFRDAPLTIAYIEEDNLSKAIGGYIIEKMTEVGFNVSLSPLPWETFQSEVLVNKNYEMAIVRYSGNIDPHKIMDRFTTRTAKNISNYYNFDYNKLMREEKDNYSKMVEMVMAETPEVFILDPGYSFMINAKYTMPRNYPYPYINFSSIEYTD